VVVVVVAAAAVQQDGHKLKTSEHDMGS
jgi:hypothetical protein